LRDGEKERLVFQIYGENIYNFLQRRRLQSFRGNFKNEHFFVYFRKNSEKCAPFDQN